jgi:hypothetical protein
MVKTPDGQCSQYDTLNKIDALEWQLRQIDEFYTFFAIMGLCEQFRLGIQVFNKVGIGRGESTEAATKRYKDFVYQLVINGIGTHPAG